MKEVLRKSLELFRKHPVLWVPYLAAELLAIWQWHQRGELEKAIFRWFSTSHSALGGEIVAGISNRANLARASMAYAPIGFMTMYSVICLFTVAMVTTAEMVNAVRRGERATLGASFKGVAARWPGILKFSFKFLLAFLVLMGTSICLLLLWAKTTQAGEIPTALWVTSLEGTLLSGCLAWLLTPAAIQLLRVPNQEPTSIEVTWRGATLAVLATAATSVLAILAQQVQKGMLIDTVAEREMVSLLIKVAVNLPDALLFISLALLAREGMSMAQIRVEDTVVEPEPAD
jgi:hypothetical protein